MFGKIHRTLLSTMKLNEACGCSVNHPVFGNCSVMIIGSEDLLNAFQNLPFLKTRTPNLLGLDKGVSGSQSHRASDNDAFTELISEQ